MYYYMKTDIGPKNYTVPFRKGHYFGMVMANSPEEAEFFFRNKMAKTLSRGYVLSNRQAASKRMSMKDFEVVEYHPVQGDPHWHARVTAADTI